MGNCYADLSNKEVIKSQELKAEQWKEYLLSGFNSLFLWTWI